MSIEKPTTLAELSSLLRRPDLWPRGFQFNWGATVTCAKGLLFEVHGRPGVREGGWPTMEWMAKTLGMPVDQKHLLDVEYLFMDCALDREPTAAATADRIDDFLRKRRYAELGIDPTSPNPDGSDYHLMDTVDDEIKGASK